MIVHSGLPQQAANLEKIVVLDNACGTGIVTKHLYEGDLLDESAKSKLEVTAADYADTMVASVKARAEKQGWRNITVVAADAMDTKLLSDHFTHVMFNFGPFVLPRPSKGLQECRRMLQTNGYVGVTSWEAIPWLEEYKPVFDANPEFPPWPTGIGFTKFFAENFDVAQDWDTPEMVKQHLEENGFVDVEAKVEVRETTFNLEQTKMSLPGSLGMVKNLMWTKEQAEKWGKTVEDAVWEHLKNKYSSGTVNWTWRGIVCNGRKP